MMRAAVCAGVALVLSGFSASGLEAQASAGSIGLDVGLFSPRSTFDDGNYDGNTFESAVGFGVTGAFWPRRSYFGVRGRFLLTDVNGVNPNFADAPIAVNDPKIAVLSVELAVRYPIERASFTAAPYVAGGVGVKSYFWELRVQPDYVLAYTLAAGAEVRPSSLGSLGFSAEVRSVQSDFYFFGVQRSDGDLDAPYGGGVTGESNLDLMFTVGVSWNW